jgi:MFS transporter, DHA3 family, macrolide efflux protein
MDKEKTKHTQNLRTFYILILTQMFSLIGSRISGFAISIWVYAETGNATPLAMVAFFSTLPMVFASGLSGVLADRWDRRYVMVLADAGQAFGTVLLLISFSSDGFQIWHLYGVSFISAIFAVFQGPAFSASVTMLIPDDQRDRANAIRQLGSPVSGVVAPALAAFVYAWVGVTGAIWVDLATFVVAVMVVFSIHIPRPKQTEEGKAMAGSVWKEMVGGFAYLFARKPLFFMMLYTSLLNFLLNIAGVLFTPYILSRTGHDEAALGALMSFMNAGAIVGVLGVGLWGGIRPRMKAIIPSIILVGIFAALVGVSQSPYTIGAFVFLVMLPIPVVNTLFSSILQIKVAPDVQGRVFASLGQISMLLSPLAFLLAGPLADQVFEPMVSTSSWQTFAPLVGDGAGAGIGLIFVMSGTLIVFSSIVTFLVPSIRKLEAILPDFEPVADQDAEDYFEPEQPVDAPIIEPEPAPAI